VITADGRDLSGEEWRTIPGFSKYQITRDGDVRNGRTGRLLREWQNPRTGCYSYTLWRDGGGKTCRTYESLVRDTWDVCEAAA
jgi:hypothetical protein